MAQLMTADLKSQDLAIGFDSLLDAPDGNGFAFIAASFHQKQAFGAVIGSGFEVTL